ncbi:MAG: hypothetical protein RIS35_915 [Pseudomonadota bacterium]|jgi:AcrR family transcriptional regulator
MAGAAEQALTAVDDDVKRAAPLRTVQPRARATRDALLSAGRALLEDRDFDAMSIAELAGAIGLSVGSFYGRFHDKASYFVLLQEQVTAEWLTDARALLARLTETPSPARFVDAVCSTLVALFRRDRGFVRAVLKHASNHPDGWMLMRRTGEVFVGEMVATLAPRLTHLDPDQRELRIRFAMQMLFGTVVNAVLNDPGPYRLADARLERELAQAVSAYLGIEA